MVMSLSKLTGLDKLFLYLFCNLLELLLGEGDFFPSEVNVGFRIHGNQVNVRVWHFQSQNHLCHFLTREGLLQGCCHAFGKQLEGGQFLVVHVEDVVHFASGNDEYVSACHGVDVKEGVELLVLGALVAGNLSSGDFAEYIHFLSFCFSLR